MGNGRHLEVFRTICGMLDEGFDDQLLCIDFRGVQKFGEQLMEN